MRRECQALRWRHHSSGKAATEVEAGAAAAAMPQQQQQEVGQQHLQVAAGPVGAGAAGDDDMVTVQKRGSHAIWKCSGKSWHTADLQWRSIHQTMLQSTSYSKGLCRASTCNAQEQQPLTMLG